MPVRSRGKAPLSHRVAIWFFTLAFAALVYWLTGYFLRDIHNLPRPDFAKFEAKYLDPKLLKEKERIEKEIAQAERTIAEQKQRQQVLAESTNSSRATMHQFQEFRRIHLERDEALSQEERDAFAESQKQFLDNQKHYQELNATIATQTIRLQELKRDQTDLQTEMAEAYEPVNVAYNAALERRGMLMAGLELAVLIPCSVVAVVLFLKGRDSIYKPLVYAFGIAVLARMGMVIYEYCPPRYFKYILIVFAILAVVRILIALLRMVAYPKQDWLLKKYREAYLRFECPICDYPIRRGPLRFVYWTRRTLKRLGNLVDDTPPEDTPYVCPSCATSLYEECEKCGKIRHSLLPACDHCGDSRPIPLESEKGGMGVVEHPEAEGE